MLQRKRLTRLTIGLATVAVVGFGTVGSVRAGAKTEKPPTLAEIQAVMDRYFRAVVDGEFEKAMAEKCARARVDARGKKDFLRQAKELIASEKITGVTVESGTPIFGPSEIPGATWFDYTVQQRTKSDMPIHAYVVREKGAVRICLTYRPAVLTVMKELEKASGSGPARNKAAREWIFPAPPKGMKQIEDRKAEGTQRPAGWKEGWTRAWRREGFGGARATVEVYATEADAIASFRDMKLELRHVADSVFKISSMGFAVGVRTAPLNWTLLQAPATSYQCDHVNSRYGNTLVLVGNCGLQPSESNDVAIAIATAIDQAN